jgi:apolipoprotein N-acyltransferase
MPASDPARHTPQTSRLSAWLMPIAAGLLFALLMAVAFPGVGFWPAAVLAPAPLAAVAVVHANRRWGAAPLRSSRARRTWCALRTLLLVSLGVLPFQLYQHQFIINISAFGSFRSRRQCR